MSILFTLFTAMGVGVLIGLLITVSAAFNRCHHVWVTSERFETKDGPKTIQMNKSCKRVTISRFCGKHRAEPVENTLVYHFRDFAKFGTMNGEPYE